VELRHLRYFVAVAEELHFRRAAERLYVAQPAVSEQIRKLEAELGVRLFDRTNRNVALTDAGSAMLDEARRVLEQAEVAQLAARSARDRAAARLRIGYVPDAVPASVPRTLGHLASAPGHLDVSLETGPAQSLIDAVRDGRLDAVIAGIPAPTSGLRTTSLGRQRVVAAVPGQDPRALDPELTLERLAPQRLVMFPRAANPAFHDAVMALCRDAALSPTLIEAAEPRVEFVLLAVVAGAGAALLPASVIERYAIPGARLVELADTEPVFESAVLTHPDTDNLATLALVRALSRAAQRESAAVWPAHRGAAAAETRLAA
jgi:DNA-binding transcriptional LysR family regulator